jgi:hypothetical protein
MTEKEIRDLFAKHDIDLARDDVWSVQGALVVKHKALERLAATLKVRFLPPQIIRYERDEAVILATGRCGEAEEWSIGEALATDGTRPGNYRVSGKMAPYVYAMAEKRAKDRVILKLAGLHGAYSEDEADDFKQAPEPARQEAKRIQAGPELFPKIKAAIIATETERDYFAAIDERNREIAALSDEDKAALRAVCHTHLENIRAQKVAA